MEDDDDDDDDDVNIHHDRQRSVAFVLKFALFFAFLRRGSFFFVQTVCFFFVLHAFASFHSQVSSLSSVRLHDRHRRSSDKGE